jgi:NAD+ kinase
VVLISRTDREDSIELAEKIYGFLKDRGLEVLVEECLASNVKVEGVNLQGIKADLAVVVGGDGTVLRAVYQLEAKVPLLTVSMGRVSFYGEALPDEALNVLDAALKGWLLKEKCFMIEADVEGLPPALNEIRIGGKIPQRMIELSVLINDLEVARDRVDAILVSTPSGASAYALSAGASIVDPKLNALLIVPVCPLSANFKPYIVPSNVEVSIKPELPADVDWIVGVDGHSVKKLSPPRTVKVKRSSREAVFLRRKENFYERLKRRLMRS